MRTQTVAAITMVWNHPVYLAKWVDHYGKALGRENLYVISHGPDPRHRAVSEGTNYIEIPRVINANLEVRRMAMLSSFVRALLVPHRVVIMTDVDELIAIDPAEGVGLREYLLARMAPATGPEVLAPLGLHLIPEPPEAGPPPQIDWSQPLLRQMPRVLPRAPYCKPCITRVPLQFAVGGHGLREARSFEIAPKLYGFHIKFADAEAMAGYLSALSAELKQARVEDEARGKVWAVPSDLRRSVEETEARRLRMSQKRDEEGEHRLAEAVAFFNSKIEQRKNANGQPLVQVWPEPDALAPMHLPERLRDLL